ncbi:MAG: SRPBCC family protein, partial [Hyphomicrobium sp.]
MVTGTTVEIAGALARWPRAEAWLRVGALLLLAALCVMPAAALEIGAAEESELKTGGVPIRVEADTRGDADGVIDAVIDIKAPPARVWSVMLDCEKAVRFLPALTSCRVLETARDGASDVREHKSKWLAILPEMTSVFRSDYLPG